MKSIENAAAETFSLMGGVELIVIVNPYCNELDKVLFEPVWQGTYDNEVELSLEDIRIQVEQKYGKSLITVIAEYPLSGDVYRYGNYEGAGWIQIGTVCGYA